MLTKLPNIITFTTLFTFRPVKTCKKKKIIIPNHPLSILVTYFTQSKGLISLTSFLSSLDALENEQNSNNDDREVSLSRFRLPNVTRPCIEINREDKRENVAHCLHTLPVGPTLIVHSLLAAWLRSGSGTASGG